MILASDAEFYQWASTPAGAAIVIAFLITGAFVFWCIAKY